MLGLRWVYNLWMRVTAVYAPYCTQLWMRVTAVDRCLCMCSLLACKLSWRSCQTLEDLKQLLALHLAWPHRTLEDWDTVKLQSLQTLARVVRNSTIGEKGLTHNTTKTNFSQLCARPPIASRKKHSTHKLHTQKKQTIIIWDYLYKHEMLRSQRVLPSNFVCWLDCLEAVTPLDAQHGWP